MNSFRNHITKASLALFTLFVLVNFSLAQFEAALIQQVGIDSKVSQVLADLEEEKDSKESESEKWEEITEIDLFHFSSQLDYTVGLPFYPRPLLPS